MAIPGMFSGLAAGAMQGGDEDPRKRAFMQMLAQRQGGQLPQQGTQLPNPGMPQGPGMFSALPPGAAPRAGGPQQPQAVPGAATTEQAAADRALALRKAGASPGQPQTQQTGMFTPISQRSAAGNIFAGDKQWYQGLFDETDRTGPFDSFFVNRDSSNAWL